MDVWPALLTLAAAVAACSPLGAPPGGGENPNVVLVTIDTLRADRLGSYGYHYPTSPQIDPFASTGVLFERGIAASSSTSPSHASMMTSRFTREHSIGFATELNRKVFERIAEQTNARVFTWLDATAESDKPFFLWVHYQDPHGPYSPPSDYIGRIVVPPQQGEPILPINERSTSGMRGIPSYQALEGLTRPSQYAGRYADEILYTDAAFGHLLERIDADPSGRPSVVLLTADHGESFGENEIYFQHAHSTLPHLAHVPFILRSRGLEPRRVPFVVSHVDIMPTLLELAGAMPRWAGKEDFSGVALGPILRGENELEERWVYCDIGLRLSAYRGNSLIQVDHIGGAWVKPEDRLEPVINSVWTRYDWESGLNMNPGSVSKAQRASIYAYFRNAVPMVHAPEPSDAEVEALRALGYIDE